MVRVNLPTKKHLTGVIGASFIFLLSELFRRKNEIAKIVVYPTDSSSKLLNGSLDTFDFIIIGGGTAGCVLANRLSQIHRWSVLVVEAGGYPSVTTEVPGLYFTLMNTKEDWNFTSERDKNFCQGMANKRCKLPRGKVLGGTTTINSGAHYRGNNNDFKKWLQDEDLEEYWSMEKIEMFQYRIEQYISMAWQVTNYGNAGEIMLQPYSFSSPIKDTILEAAETLLYKRMKYGESLGYVEVLGALFNGSKVNNAKAFLTPVKHRRNLYLALNAEVEKIVVTNPRDRRACGVMVRIGEELVEIKAKKEVLLTAGAVNTPKLLMLSGIGPSEHLKSLDIPVLGDLPVGENLQDHFCQFILASIDPNLAPEYSNYSYHDGMYDYFSKKSGELMTINIMDLVGMISTHYSHEFPNTEVMHYYFKQNDNYIENFLNMLGYDQQIVESIIKHNKEKPLIAFMPCRLNPASRGEIRLKSRDPKDPALIFQNQLQNPRDQQRCYQNYKYVQRLIASEPFQKLGAEIVNFNIPNCNSKQFLSDAYINCTITNLGYPKSQMAGTCRMGNWHDSCTVVGSNLNVKGFRGLRVVDASIMPYLISADTHSTVAMVAGRAAEIIKKRWIENYQLDESQVTKPGENIA